MSKSKADGFLPFRYGQKVRFFGSKSDGHIEGKVQGTVSDNPEKLFIVTDEGDRYQVLKSSLISVDEPVEIEEGGGDRCDFTDRLPVEPKKKGAVGLYYGDEDESIDASDVVEEGDVAELTVGASGLPAGTKVRVIALVGRKVRCEELAAKTAYTAYIQPHNLKLVSRDPQFDVEAATAQVIDRDFPELSVSPKPTGFSGVDPITKDTNPKDALAGFKPRWFSFIPLQVLIGVGKAMFEGGWKYGKHNYRDSGVRATVYVDATVCGHLMPWMEGQDYDENGMHHIDKAIASLMVLRDAQINGNWIDDRPLRATNFDAHIERETAHFQEMKKSLAEKFGDPVAPYTEATRGQPRKK